MYEKTSVQGFCFEYLKYLKMYTIKFVLKQNSK